MDSWRIFARMSYKAGVSNKGVSKAHIKYITRPSESLFFRSNIATSPDQIAGAFALLEDEDLCRRKDARFCYRMVTDLPNLLSAHEVQSVLDEVILRSGIASCSYVYSVHRGLRSDREVPNLHAHILWHPRRRDTGRVDPQYAHKNWLRDFKSRLTETLSAYVEIEAVPGGTGRPHIGWRLHAVDSRLRSGRDLSDLKLTTDEMQVMIRRDQRRLGDPWMGLSRATKWQIPISRLDLPKARRQKLLIKMDWKQPFQKTLRGFRAATSPMLAIRRLNNDPSGGRVFDGFALSTAIMKRISKLVYGSLVATHEPHLLMPRKRYQIRKQRYSQLLDQPDWSPKPH
jgi:hypothetical protein